MHSYLREETDDERVVYFDFRCPISKRWWKKLKKGFLKSYGALRTFMQNNPKVKNARPNLNTVECLSEAADYVGHVSLVKQHQHANPKGQSAYNPSASFIIAGQIGDEPHGIDMVYSEGNSIMSSANTPFLQIGESKYGKPVLDRLLKVNNPIDEAASCCLISMDSTIRSNASCGAPVEMLLYRKDGFSFDEYYCFDDGDDFLLQLRRSWETKLREAAASLPRPNKGHIKQIQSTL